MSTDQPQKCCQQAPPIVGLVRVAWVLAITAFVGYLAWQQFGPHDEPDPPNPNPPGPVDDNISAVSESVITNIDKLVDRLGQQAKRYRNRDEWLRGAIVERLYESFLPVDKILDVTSRTQRDRFPQVFGAIQSGFAHGSDGLRRTLHHEHSEHIATFGESLAAAFGEASAKARRGEGEDVVHAFLADANHVSLDNLIQSIASSPRRGYLIEEENREELHRTQTPITFTSMHFDAPDEIDPRHWHQVEDQGQMGSCQGHAQSSVCEMADYISHRRVRQFSRLFAYLVSQKFDGILGSDRGSTLASGLRAAKEVGSCLETVMPYPNPVQYTSKIPANAFQSATPNKITRHTVCRSYPDVFNFIASGQGGVEIGIRWPNTWMKCDGVIGDQPGESFRPGEGGHAVCFLGYSKRTDNQGRKYLWLANSWGTRWGNGGYAEVAPEVVEQMASHPDTVMIGLSDMTGEVRPRDVSWIGKGSVFRQEQSDRRRQPVSSVFAAI